MTMRWTIRAKLTGLVLAVLLPLIAAAAVKFWLEVEQGREDAQADMIESAHAVAQLFDEILSGQIENIEALASVRAIDRIQDEDLVAAAARVKRHHGFIHRVLAARPDGEITAASDVAGAAAPAPFPGLDVLQDRAPRAPASGRLTPAEPDGRAPGGAARRSGVRPRRSSTRRDGGRDRSAGGLGIPRSRSAHSRNVCGHRHGHRHAGGARGQARRPWGGRFLLPPSAEALIRARAGVAEWAWEGGVVNSLTAAAPMACAPGVALAAMPRDLAYAPAAKGLRRNLIG